MTTLFILITILSAVIIQTTLMAHFFPFYFKPDLLLIVAVYFGLSQGQIAGTMAGFMAGLLQDMLSGGLLGINSLSKGFIGFFCGYARGQLAGRNFVSQSFLLFIFTVIEGIFGQFVSFVAFTNTVPLKFVVTKLLWLALANSIIGCLLIHLLSRCKEKVIIKRRTKESRFVHYRGR